MSSVTGISRYGFYKLAHAKRVLHYRDAATELPALAEAVFEANERKRIAMQRRDEMIVALVDSGMSHESVAELIGRKRSRVTQIVSAHKKDAE